MTELLFIIRRFCIDNRDILNNILDIRTPCFKVTRNRRIFSMVETLSIVILLLFLLFHVLIPYLNVLILIPFTLITHNNFPFSQTITFLFQFSIFIALLIIYLLLLTIILTVSINLFLTTSPTSRFSHIILTIIAIVNNIISIFELRVMVCMVTYCL